MEIATTHPYYFIPEDIRIIYAFWQIPDDIAIFEGYG